jgi:NAD(P)-dependent dehydrogenase (short-subunit alcohol dehydrogenase family)
MSERFTGKVAIVTGGGRGIGRAVVALLRAEGASVLVADRDEEPAAETAQTFGCPYFVGNTTHREEVARMVATTVEQFGRLDVLIANAGTANVQPLLEIDNGTWEHILRTNLTGTFLCVQEAARAMRALGNGGAMVLTASTNGFFVESNLAHYNSSKGAVLALTRSAALDLAPLGIRVNAVAPGVVRTRLAQFLIDDPVESADYLKRIPLNRFAEPEDVAHAILFLASEEASYITGQSLVLDGGLSLGVPLAVPDAPLPGSVPDRP